MQHSKLKGQSRVEHMIQNEDKQNTIQHCVRSVSYAPCRLCLWIFHSYCPFNGYCVVLCFLFLSSLRSVSYAPCCLWHWIVHYDCPFRGYCAVLCFACMSFVSCVPCCLCLWVVHSCLPLQGLLCCIVFCLSSFCIICSTLDCPFSLLCCIVLWLSSFCILCFDTCNMEHNIQKEDNQSRMQHSKLKGQTRVDDPVTHAIWSIIYRKKTIKAQCNTVNYRVALCFACLLSVSYAPYWMCLWGRSLLIVPSTVTLLYCVCLSSVSILCSILPVSGVVHSRLSLQRLLCCIVFCLCSFCILCSIFPLSLGSSTLVWHNKLN
jgi:hypothetical protein